MSSPSYAEKSNNGTYDEDPTATVDGSHGNNGTGGSTQITIQLNTDMTAAQRFPTWIVLCVSSIICVLALHSRRGLLDVDGPGEAWILSVGAISFLLSLSAIVMYLCFRNIFVSNIPEAVMVGLLIAFWAAGLPTIMNPNNRIAVATPADTNVGSVVVNANLYFFSWCAFCCTIFLCASLLQDTMNISLSLIAAKVARWFALVASTLIVLGCSVRTYKAASCSDPEGDSDSNTTTEYCKRCKLAISLGVIGFAISTIMTTLLLLKQQLTAFSEFAINTVFLILWCFGVSYITFGASPGSTIGNLYFSTWITFLMSVFSFAVSFREFVSSRQQAATNNDNEQEPPQPEF